MHRWWGRQLMRLFYCITDADFQRLRMDQIDTMYEYMVDTFPSN